jgi:hypothetical protein
LARGILVHAENVVIVLCHACAFRLERVTPWMYKAGVRCVAVAS